MSDFLETPEGPDWLHDAINSLICGDNVTAPRAHGKSVALVTPQSLWRRSQSTWVLWNTSPRC